MLALVFVFGLVVGFGLGMAATGWWLWLDGRRQARRAREGVEYVELPTPTGKDMLAQWERDWPVEER